MPIQKLTFTRGGYEPVYINKQDFSDHDLRLANNNE